MVPEAIQEWSDEKQHPETSTINESYTGSKHNATRKRVTDVARKSPTFSKVSLLHEVFLVPLSLSPWASTLYNARLFHSLVLLAHSFSQFRKASCRRWALKSLIDGHSTFSETQEDNQGRKEECL